MTAKLLFLGDFAPVDSISSLHMNHAGDTFDACLVNLETPIMSNKAQARARPKAGPHLSGNARLFNSVMNSNYIVNLANNHIMDFGDEGLINTLDICEKSSILTVGAGKNLFESQKPGIININGITIGIIGCAENQFGAASSHRGGYASLTQGKTERLVHQTSQNVDICIVSIHGGSEFAPWPSPQWQDMVRGFIDLGASIIHGHHSHVPQGFEEYNDGLIFYGLGNFLVDPSPWHAIHHALWSLTPVVTVSKNGIEHYDIKTSVIEKDNNSVVIRESNHEEFVLHTNYLDTINSALADKELLAAIWQEVSVRLFSINYRCLYFPTSFFFSRQVLTKLNLLVLQMLLKRKIIPQKTDQMLLWYYLFTANKSHHHAIATALGIMSGECEDLRDKNTSKIVDAMMPWSKNPRIPSSVPMKK